MPCSQMAEPSHFVQKDRCTPCSQMPPPLHFVHWYRFLPCSQNKLGLQMAQLHLNLPCGHFLRILPIFLTISQIYDRSSLCSISFFTGNKLNQTKSLKAPCQKSQSHF